MKPIWLLSSHKGGAGLSFCARNLAWLQSRKTPTRLLEPILRRQQDYVSHDTPRASDLPDDWVAQVQADKDKTWLLEASLGWILQDMPVSFRTRSVLLLVLPAEPLAYRSLSTALDALRLAWPEPPLKGIVLNQPTVPRSELDVFSAYVQSELKPYLLPRYIPYSDQAQRASLEQKDLLAMASSDSALYDAFQAIQQCLLQDTPANLSHI
ncbi:MAG: hypothetical protein IGS03_14180 [Candidatus Sericytochromatia bacterium]|nr:hypothetical protein [Candidatus Sericytochromatia bacterium]